MYSNNDAINAFKYMGAHRITVTSSQNIVRPPLAVSSIRKRHSLSESRIAC